MSMFGEVWDNGDDIAKFECTTNGPEGSWDVVMRRCVDSTKSYRVVYDPFGNRLMWFDDDRVGCVESSRAFKDLVGIAMCDADIVRLPNANG